MGKVYVHMDGAGARLGNGGFRELVYIANALAEMGYDVKAFDHLDRLSRLQFKWLNWRIHFDIAPFSEVQASDAPIITAWINVLMHDLELAHGLTMNRIRYYDCSELFRPHLAKWLRPYLSTFLEHPIAVNNRTLWRYYAQIGFREIIPLETYYRRDTFYCKIEEKMEHLVGYQSDNRKNNMIGKLKRMFEVGPGQRPGVLLCEGEQNVVAARMRTCDYFVQWNRIHDLDPIQGEMTGNSLFEAMAAGCVCFARRHDGNAGFAGAVMLVSRLQDIEPIAQRLMNDRQEREKVRGLSRGVIEKYFRLNDEKRNNLRRFVD